jgi:hypothetical protein
MSAHNTASVTRVLRNGDAKVALIAAPGVVRVEYLAGAPEGPLGRRTLYGVSAFTFIVCEGQSAIEGY